MTPKARLPTKVAERIEQFLDTGATGQIVLHVHHGRIQSVAIADHFKVNEDPIVPIETPGLPPLKTRT